MTTKCDIKMWIQRGKDQNATHLIVVCDTFDYEDYPVFVKESEDIKEKIKEYDNKDMQKIMEIYNLREDSEHQLNETKAWNL